VSSLVLEVDNHAVDAFVITVTFVPVVILLVIIWVFFRAARRNDEREALAERDRHRSNGG
jgi:hypothetical protein